MYGIDISNHQKGINLDVVPFDFLIAKATEGIGYVDRTCDYFIQKAIKLNKPFGFYHFARSINNPIKEADYFYEQCKGYFGKGLPILDWEKENKQDTNWALTWLNRIYELSGVKPLIYMSEDVENQYDWSKVVNADYGLWIAKYGANKETNGYQILTDKPKLKHWQFACMWQFTSNGKLPGYSGSLDLNEFYGNVDTWNKYAGINKQAEQPQATKLDTGSYFQQTFEGVKYHVYKQGQDVKLGMISNASNPGVNFLTWLDDTERTHFAKMNGSRFNMATGEHLGIEVNRQFENVPRQEAYLAFWVDKNQEPHWSSSRDFWLTRNDVELALSPDAILVWDGLHVNIGQGASGGQARLNVTANQSVLVRFADKRYGFIVAATDVSLLSLERYLDTLGVTYAIALDGGGSSQLQVGYNVLPSNRRKVADCLTFYAWNTDISNKKSELEQAVHDEPNAEVALKNEIERLNAIIAEKEKENQTLADKLERIDLITEEDK